MCNIANSEQNFYTNDALAANKILHHFGVILAKLLTCKLLLDFYFLFDYNCVFISGYKISAFCPVN